MNICKSSIFCINMMEVPSEHVQSVKDCIATYTKPKEKIAIIKYALYRIWNAVKYIFGRSDWQITHRLIVNKSLIGETLKSKIAIFVENSSTMPLSITQSFVSLVQEVYSTSVSRLFEKALLLNQNQTPKTDDLCENLKKEYEIKSFISKCFEELKFQVDEHL